MPQTIHYGDITVQTALHQVLRSGKQVMLTDTEYRLLLYLLGHQGVACRRNDIIDGVWGKQFLYDTGTLDVHLSSLRHKLGWTKEGPLRAIRSVGFILPHPENDSPAIVKLDPFLRELLMSYEDDIRSKDIRCYLRLTPFVYEIQADEALLREIFSAVFALFLCHAPSGAKWEIASRLTTREYTLTITSTGTCPDFSPAASARRQAAFLGIPIRMGNKHTHEGDFMGVELNIPIESQDS